MTKLFLNFEHLPKKGFLFNIKLNEIQYSEFQKEKETYNFFYEDKKIKIKLTFKNDFFYLIDDRLPLGKKNKNLIRPPVTVRKHKKGYIDFIYELDLSTIKKHNFLNGPLKIHLENVLIEGSIILKLSPENLKGLLHIEKEKVKERKMGRTLVKIRTETKLDPFDKEIKSENKIDTQSPYIKNELARFGIYLTYPNAYKRCFNCANYTDKECTAYNRIEVSSNHTCRRFYSYKTYLGGGFSPR